MSIQSPDDYLAAQRQIIPFIKLLSGTAANSNYQMGFPFIGIPPAGSLSASDAVNGIVPVAGTDGFPKIAAFPSGGVGYLSRARISGWNNSGKVFLYDHLYRIGAFTATAATTVNPTAPDYSGRLPNGDATRTLLLLECSATMHPGGQVTVTYTNEAGVTGRTTTYNFTTSPYLGGYSIVEVPLQAGDKGVKSIQSISYSGLTAGDGFNVSVVRPLLDFFTDNISFTDTFDLFRTGMPQVFQTSALSLFYNGDGTNITIPVGLIEIASK